MSKNPTIVETFLTRLKWKTVSKDFQGMTAFSIDCFSFKFNKPLSQETQYQFFEYAETLDLREERSILILFIWLYQHNADFRLKFKWNRNLSFKYNLKQLRKPKTHEKSLLRQKDELMTFDLSVFAKRRKENLLV